MPTLNETHDPALQSWVEAANAPDADFPLQNLPFGVFVHPDSGGAKVGVAIGDSILDVAAAYDRDVIGARRAGLTPILIDPFEVVAEQDVIRVKSLGKLVEIFRDGKTAD